MEAQDQVETTTASGSIGWLFVFLIICIFVYGAYATTPHPRAQVAQPAAVPAAPGGGHSIYGQPTISAGQIDAILAAYQSPARGQGQTLYDLGVRYGVDPAYALAFFMHESTLGTQGEARSTHSLGNLRCIDGAACVDRDRGGYAAFANWHDGFQAWFVLLSSNLYKGDGLTTVEVIIPRYAPSGDHNNETAYISALVYCVQSWQGGKVEL